AIVRTLLVLAHELGLKVIAEEVEQQEQLDFLLEHDCDYIQGFLFSRPVPLAELEQTLTPSSAASPLPERARRDGGRGPSSPPS
ncbi:MAG TPA: EAL domain-containing protein, partial [Thermoanaerobaculia bacterium]|nr:EAL domain-containing protein [Thermoanaerobaculia bacterium]